jgi:hypothetical protein
MEKFWKDSILLLYGTSRVGFDAWTPTFLQKLGEWAMTGDCELHMGWIHDDIMKGVSKAKADHLGAPHFMLRGMLTEFCRRMETFKVTFRVSTLDAHHLPARLASWKENRGNLGELSWMYRTPP